MEPITYTYKDKYNKDIVTVCLVKAKKAFARGIALCSKLDHLNHQLGEIKAKGRAIKACTREKSEFPINRNEAIRVLFEAGAPPFKYKAEYNAKLTDQEKELAKG